MKRSIKSGQNQFTQRSHSGKPQIRFFNGTIPYKNGYVGDSAKILKEVLRNYHEKSLGNISIFSVFMLYVYK